MGLDLAAANSGVCIIEAQFPDYQYTVLLEEALNHPTNSFINRSEAADYILHLIKDNDVDVVSIEDYARRFGNTNTSGFEYGEFGGMVRKVLYDARVPFYVVPPTTMRSFMAAPPKSPKDFLEVQAEKRLGYVSSASSKKKRSDITDAFIHAHIGSLVHILRNGTLNYSMTPAENRIIFGDSKIIGLKDREGIYHAAKED